MDKIEQFILDFIKYAYDTITFHDVAFDGKLTTLDTKDIVNVSADGKIVILENTDGMVFQVDMIQ